MTIHKESLMAIQDIRTCAKQQARITFVSGNFNVLHPGHLRLLRFASECGDYLVVGVSEDGSGGTLLPEWLRLEGLQSNSWVDHAFVLRDSPKDFILALEPATVVKGKEHESQLNSEQEAVDSYGGSLLFGSGDISFSSVDILREEFHKLNLSSIVIPPEYPLRHNFNLDSIKEIVESVQSLKICVIGDLIVDEYIDCDPLGMSQEDPTLVVSPILKQKFIGGAGIVAAHAAGLGAKVNFLSIVGEDEASQFARDELQKHQVNFSLFKDETRPTSLKQRFRAHEKTLLRVSYLRQHEIRKELQEKLFVDVVALLDQTDLLVFSDFNYGCLPTSLVTRIIDECKKRNVYMVADSQCSSQIGDVSRFKNMSLLTPTEREARISVRDFDSGLVVLADKLQNKSECKNVLMTLGGEGILIHANISEENEWLTDRLPAFNGSPKDSAGAGDSMLISTAMSLALGNSIWESAFLGSLAAATQVGRVGNIPLSASEVLAELSI